MPRATAPTSCSARATCPAAASRAGRCTGACSHAPEAATPPPCSASRSRDLTGGFKCFRAGALRALDGDLVHSRGYAFQIELTFHAARAGLEIAEIPIVFREREHGTSKMSPAIALEAMWRVPLMRIGSIEPAADRVTPRAAR